MPDWIAYVRERLTLESLNPARQEEIIRDLADQLAQVHDDALAGGASADEAESTARRQIGDWPALARELTASNSGRRRSAVDRWTERHQDALDGSRGRLGAVGRWVEAMGLDLVYGCRQLLSHRGHTLVAVLTLTLGIGVNTAMFGLVRALLSGGSAFPESDRLVLVRSTTPDRLPAAIGQVEFAAFSGQRGSFSGLAAFDLVGRTLTGIESPLTVRVVRCSADFGPMLGLTAVVGRMPTPSEHAPGAAPVVVITERLWNRGFSRDVGVVGRDVSLDGVSHTIVGVLPESVALEQLAYGPFDMLAPLDPGAARSAAGPATYRMVARLAEGVTREQGAAVLSGIAAGLPRTDGSAAGVRAIDLQPLEEFLVPFGRRIMSVALMAAVSLVLLIACLNLASLSVARSSARGREFAIRGALGAGRGRILRQLLIENLLLAAAGGVLGVLTGVWVLRLINLADDAPLYVRQALRIDPVLIGHALVLCVLAVLVFGLLPAVWMTRRSGALTLRADPGTGASSGARRRLRAALVVGELAVGVPLLVSMGLVLRHLDALTSADLGFRADHLVAMRVELPAFRYGSAPSRSAFTHDVLERLRGMPALSSVGASSSFPVGAGGVRLGVSTRPEGSSASAPREPESIGYEVVTPGYIETLGVPLLAGRQVSDADTAASERVAIVNRRLADRYWPDGQAVGRAIVLAPDGQEARRVTVVGVVADFGRTMAGHPAEPRMYFPLAQEPSAALTIVARGAGGAAAPANAMRRMVRSLDADVPVGETLTAAEIVRRWLRDDQVLAWFLSSMAVLAITLGVIGLYGLTAQLVVQRTREIGVRMAVGASRTAVWRMVILRSARLAAIGLVVGGVVSVPVGLAIATELYGVSGVDPLSFALVAGVLLLASVVAALVPAWRASRVDPTIALRYDQ